MPCWYYEKQELRDTPSIRNGIDYETEARYRREGARFIMDTGNKMGLRHDTYATGVVYFHRFYMFHSFREFPRHVIAACCLFLAGKVEETPKKCKDLIRVARMQLTDQQFQLFGDDPKEEVMTLERVLLQTIKFDLQVEHPYYSLLQYAKLLNAPTISKSDSQKIQKMVQMAWTFINDSLCTTLCLQWEPDIISVALMYLASRLSKFDITDWIGKPPGYKGKWYEFLVEDVTLELLEDICHQVLDLYSQEQQKRDDSPPPPPPPPRNTTTQHPPAKRHRPTPPSEPPRPVSSAPVSHSESSQSRSKSTSPVPRREDPKRVEKIKAVNPPTGQSIPPATHLNVAATSQALTRHASPADRSLPVHTGHPPPIDPTTTGNNTSGQYTSYNPYVSSNMYSASFMSQEGSRDIRNLLGNSSSARPSPGVNPGYNQPPRPHGPPPPPRSGGQISQYPPQTSAPPAGYPQQYQGPPPNSQGNVTAPGYQQPPPPSYPQQQGYPPSAGYNPPGQYNQGGYSQPAPVSGYNGPPPPGGQSQHQQPPGYPPPNFQQQSPQQCPPGPGQNFNQPNQYGMNQYNNHQMYNQQQPPQQQGHYHGYNSQVPPDGGYQNYQQPGPGGYNRPPGPYPGPPGPGGPPPNSSTGLATVRITGRR